MAVQLRYWNGLRVVGQDSIRDVEGYIASNYLATERLRSWLISMRNMQL